MSKAREPQFIAPQLAQLTAAAPAGDDWVHEIKYDGYRLVALVHRGRARLLTRNRKDWTDRFADVAAALATLPLRSAILDGEVAVQLADGTTSFQALQNALRSPGRGQLQYFVFDLLEVDGADLRSEPLLERKARLRRVLTPGADASLRYSDHVTGQGPAFHLQACAAGLEGIISKRACAPYRSGRGSDWVKVKCVQEQEFVIGGFSEPSGSRQGLGALHVGAYDDGGRLIYRGKVGTGFSDATLRDLRRRLDRLKRSGTPFHNGPRGAAARTTHWVEPELVAQVRYTELTEDGRLRHPTFEGLREDKRASEVRLERPIAGPAAGSAPAERVVKMRGGGKRTSSRGKGSAVDVAGVRLTSPNKVLYREQGLTKLDLVRHYQLVADLMLPHVRGRPLTLVRCPSGEHSHCFFQKHMDETAPPAFRRVLVEERDGPEWYGVADDLAGLVSLAQLGALEVHTSNARADRLDRPDRFLLDLDPDEGLGWERVVEAAYHCRDLLAELGLRSFVKTTGGKGLHVVVPLTRRAGWDEVKEFSGAVAEALAGAAPDRYTTELSRRKRKGRLLLDYLRNARGATAIEAWSTRRRPGATVAVPIAWDELETGIRADSFSVANLPARLAQQKRDPWSEFGAVRQSLTAPMRKRLGL